MPLLQYSFAKMKEKIEKIEKNKLSIDTLFNNIVYGPIHNNIEFADIHIGIEKVVDNAFANCSNLKTVVIGPSCYEIGEGAFSCCESLESVVIYSTHCQIKDGAFRNCPNLKSVEYKPYKRRVYMVETPTSSFGKQCFAGCSHLTNIQFATDVQTIPEECFAGCAALTNLTLPNNIQFINKRAFANSGLKNLTISSGLLELNVDVKAFDECNIKTIVVPAHLAPMYQKSKKFNSEIYNFSSKIVEENKEEEYNK